MPDIWKMLEIEPTKDVAIIKRAYAALAKKYHPEQYPEEFLNLRNAYEAAMDYASNGNGAFFVGSELQNEISFPQKTERMNAEEINENEREEQEISESGYWDLSKLNEQSEADCTEAFAQFLEVWREESFTKMLWNVVLENMENYPINKTFAKCLNVAYGCFVYAPHSFTEVQYQQHFLFDGFSYIEKILELGGNMGKMVQNDLSMFISFCEYRVLESVAEGN